MAGSNITCRLFAAFERFKNPNLIRLAKYLPAYKGKIGLAFISSRLGWCLRLRSG